MANTENILIVIPTYNREEKILSTLRSASDSSNDNARIVVVDDGSQDNTFNTVMEYIKANSLAPQISCLKQENQGPSAARNKGSQGSTSAYIAFLDSDDRWFQSTLSTVKRAVKEYPDASLIFLETVDFLEGKEPPLQSSGSITFSHYPTFLEAVKHNRLFRFATCNVVIKTSAFQNSNGFDTAFRSSEDSDLFLRMNETGGCVLIQGAPLVAHEVGAFGSITNNLPAVVQGHSLMKDRWVKGGYRGDTDLLGSFIAKSVVYTTRLSFSSGQVILAYRLLFLNVLLLIRNGEAKWVWRLLLAPILAYVKRLKKITS